MDEIGFEDGELDELLFMKCKRKQSVNREKLKLQIAVADLHQRMMDEVRARNPRYMECPECDGPVISPAMLFILESDRKWKKIVGMKVSELQQAVYAKASPEYQKAMEANESFDNLERTVGEVLKSRG